MSSYLSFYIVPKKERKHYCFENNSEETVKLSEGIPLFLTSYSRNSDIYQAFYENVSVAYCGNEEKYTELTLEIMNDVVSAIERDIKSIENELDVNYKMLKQAYNSDLYSDIHSEERYLSEQKELLEHLHWIEILVHDCYDEYSDFEKVLINVD